MDLDDGFEFPWGEGGVALLRRELYPQVARWTHCGIAVDTQTQIQNYPGMTHLVDQAYQYVIMAFLGNGMASVMVQPQRLDFDSAGNLITPSLPNFPIDICAVSLAGGQFRVSWTYSSYGQGAAPKDFQVFEGADAGSVNYGVPLVDSLSGLNVVAARSGSRVYSLTTAAFADQSMHLFGVRSRNIIGTVEKNTFVTQALVAQAAVPQAVQTPRAIHIRSYSPAGGGVDGS